MRIELSQRATLACAVALALAGWDPLLSAKEPINFSREILPILSDRCFHCHGPDPGHRKADLRLDEESEAKRDRDGIKVIASGNLRASELWQRIIAEDEGEIMPPPDSHRKALSESERYLIRRWIEEGAVWGKHWAFEKPVRPTLSGSALHPVDFFIRRRLERDGLAPSPPAPPKVQLRRLSFGLTGLPPTLQEVKAFATATAVYGYYAKQYFLT